MAAIVVEVDDQPLERVSADLVVVGHSPDDRPLRGAAGRADWRLCGELWQLITAQKLDGRCGQAALLSAACAHAAQSSAYPDRPIRLVIGSAAGSGW